jgi:cation-transporting ATPase 13A1
VLTPASDSPYAVTLTIRRRFQFSSALKRMSTIASLPGGRLVAAVKGAPETIKGMLAEVPRDYDETYKWYTRQGSRVLALGMKEMEGMPAEKVRALWCFWFWFGCGKGGWLMFVWVVD